MIAFVGSVNYLWVIALFQMAGTVDIFSVQILSRHSIVFLGQFMRLLSAGITIDQ